MLLLTSLVFVLLDGLLGAPTGREVYRMPQSALKGIFKPFSFQFGPLSYLMEVVGSVFSSNDSLESAFMQRRRRVPSEGSGDFEQVKTTFRALKFFLVNRRG